MTVVIRYRPQGPVLDEYYRCREPRHFIRGPMGSAKTSTSFWKLFELAQQQAPNAQGVRPSSWYIVRNTYTDLVGTTIADWKRTFAPIRGIPEMLMSPVPHHDMRYRLQDGTTVEASYTFIGLDRPEDVRRIMGGNISGVFINEVRYIPLSVINDLGTRVWRYPSLGLGGVECTWGGIFGDTNSPSDEHWYYEKAEKERPEGWAFFSQPPAVLRGEDGWVVNPQAENLHNLHERYYADMLGNADDWVRVNLGNEYGHFQEGRPVYTDYHDGVHCFRFELDPNLPLILGWDFGLTPTCVIGQLSKRGQLRIRYELCAENMGVKRFARDVVKPFLGRLKGFHIGASWADPSGTGRGDADEKASIGMLNDAYDDEAETLSMGFWTEPADTNLLVPRLEAVRGYLNRMIDGAPGFVLHPDCKKLRQGFAGKYCLRKVRIVGPERYHDTPDKNEFSHCFVAGTQIATPEGARPIEALAVGDLVDTPMGPSRVVSTMSSVPDELCLVNGDIEATPDHPFATTRGFVRADALQYSDLVFTSGHRWAESEFIQYRNTTASGSITSPLAITNRTGATADGICTGPYGSPTTARFQQAATYTTRTVTGRTTDLRTLSVFLPQSTAQCTGSKGSQPGLHKPSRTWRLFGVLRAIGTALKRAGVGIVSTLLALRSPYQPLSMSVHGAAMSTEPRRALGSGAFADLLAKALRGRHPASTITSATAESVGPSLPATNTCSADSVASVVSVSVRRNLERKRVYDLTVENAHAFYANGYLVSNCHDALQYLARAAQGGYVSEKPDESFEPETLGGRSIVTGY